ncbi:hypothetical protein EXIGLDRAFT_780486 [Exidia glandulosa HHB12029]|uniref:Uncharacterized protein n=1 Tax=Exidia glandulosa HHB12029 TaxID=1314781 RepID=A0A165ZAC6_EXIGL|nr:hypothetical protein EXIGLDRAFT_780486 [Exidia glandulosa HHB12029]
MFLNEVLVRILLQVQPTDNCSSCLLRLEAEDAEHGLALATTVQSRLVPRFRNHTLSASHRGRSARGIILPSNRAQSWCCFVLHDFKISYPFGILCTFECLMACSGSLGFRYVAGVRSTVSKPRQSKVVMSGRHLELARRVTGQGLTRLRGAFGRRRHDRLQPHSTLDCHETFTHRHGASPLDRFEGLDSHLPQLGVLSDSYSSDSSHVRSARRHLGSAESFRSRSNVVVMVATNSAGASIEGKHLHIVLTRLAASYALVGRHRRDYLV